MVEIIKSFVRWVTRNLVVQGPIWAIWSSKLQESLYWKIQRNVVEERSFQSKVNSTFSRLEILHGPFQGMVYPKAESCGSALWPKLIGTYERELQEGIEQLLNRSYQNIFDWGCAEGFYLVGLGMRNDKAQLFGIEPEDRARVLCQDLAKQNRLASTRLQLLPSAKLADFSEQLSEPSLIISDCEGYEEELFAEHLDLLHNSDLVIECHDHLIKGITDKLILKFEPTHKVTVITSETRSSADIPANIRTEISKRFNSTEITRLIDEGRPGTMKWIIAESRK
ncbi:hypothetical protein N9K67_05080 [Opitutaceae bacterium]|nr:hypothetical protein [Opitutaceae bacterium]